MPDDAELLSVQDLVKALGGGQVVADACGVTPQAVSNWGADGRVPARHHPAVWRLAQAKGLSWTPPGYEGLRLEPVTSHSPDDRDTGEGMQFPRLDDAA